MACHAQDPTGGETHFLRICDPGSTCADGLACLCGVCTRSCTEAADCAAWARGECIDPAASGLCAEAAPQTFCDARCVTDADCAALSPSHRCEGGRCRAGSHSSAAGGASGDGEAGGAGGATGCVSGEVTANQVSVLGDSFFGATHQITAYLEDLARGAGVLPVGERYRDHSSLLNNALALGGNGIAAQYAAAASEAPVEVVIMNGGGADILAGSCDTPPTPECPVLVEASVAAEAVLSQMALDGVTHVIYAFYPDPVDLDLRAKIDVLRPLIEAVCQASPVPCHFIDLRQTFAGSYAEYVLPDGMNPTAAGSQASAAAIWAVMLTNCIAQ